MLVRSASNFEAARALSMRPPECDAASRATPSSTILREAQQKAVAATRAYVDCDRSTLDAISDESRLVQPCFKAQSDSKAELVKACSVTGNDKLAFVSLVSRFSAVVRDPRALTFSRPGMNLGQQSILAVLTNQSGTWRLLAITHDSANTRSRIAVTTNTLVNSLEPGAPIGMTPEPARLLTPNGVYPLPPKGQYFGDFIWEPSQSTDVIGQVVEFMWAKETNAALTRLFFLPPTENKISSGLLMTAVPTVWRVWTVTRAGDIAFSDQHSFKHCPCAALCS